MPDSGYIPLDVAQKTNRKPQTILLAASAAAAFAAFLPAAAQSDPDLTRLLRAMAAIKAMAAIALIAATLWRLKAPITPTRLAAYSIACAAMAAGPGLIWNMAHVALGAALLHAGLIATLILLWRDPETHQSLQRLIARRRLNRPYP